jgi:hypothetical protein
LGEGNEEIRRSGWNGRSYRNGNPDDLFYIRFRTESLNLIRRACGEDSDHYIQLRSLTEREPKNSYYLKDCYAILEAGKNDFEGGWLFDLKALVAAELLGDFIDQADALFQNGYIHPAASLVGAVLEDTLRKLCNSNGIEIPDKTKIDSLNSNLARAGVYDKLIQKRITALADIRNNADHGHFDKYISEDVEDMIKWVRRFAADYLH